MYMHEKKTKKWHKQNTYKRSTRRLPVQRTENGYPLSTFPVTSKLVLRRFPAARAAKRRIPLDDISDGVDSQLHGRRSGESHTTASLTASSPSFTSATPRLRTSGQPRGHQTSCLSRKTD